VADAHISHRLDSDSEGGGDGSSGLSDERSNCSFNSGGNGGGGERCLVRNGEDDGDDDARGRDAQRDQAVGQLAAELILQAAAQSGLLSGTKRAHGGRNCQVQLYDGGRRGDDGLA